MNALSLFGGVEFNKIVRALEKGKHADVIPTPWKDEQPIELNEFDINLDEIRRSSVLCLINAQERAKSEALIMETFMVLDQAAEDNWQLAREKVREERKAAKKARLAVERAEQVAAEVVDKLIQDAEEETRWNTVVEEIFSKMKGSLVEWTKAKRKAWVAASERLHARLVKGDEVKDCGMATSRVEVRRANQLAQEHWERAHWDFSQLVSCLSVQG